MNDKDPCSRDWRQFLLRCRCPIYATRAARTGQGQSDNSGRWWVWTWLSPRPIWRLSSERLLRRRILRRGRGARRGGSARRGSNSARCSGSPARSARLPSLQRVPMLECLLTFWIICSQSDAPRPVRCGKWRSGVCASGRCAYETPVRGKKQTSSNF
jgi:hypothetical protein